MATGYPASDSRYGSPEVVWSARRYRTAGQPRPTVHEGEAGVALPLRRPPWWMLPVTALLALGLGASVVLGAGRLARGDVESIPKAVLGLVVITAITGVFTLGTVALWRLRRVPGEVVATPTRVVTARRQELAWEDVESISALQTRRQGNLRSVELAVAVANGRQATIFEAARLDVDPRRALTGLRALHLDPTLRASLGSGDTSHLLG